MNHVKQSRLRQPLQLHINGKDVPSASNKTFTVSNPMTGEELYECAAANVHDYEAAIQHANKAFKTWSKTTPSERRRIFLRAADILSTYLDDAEDAPAIISNEVSAVASYVKLNINASVGMLRDTAGLVTHIKGEIIPADRPGTTILVKREPLGVIFAISPWNAPVRISSI
jgi:benzaldehyde dehydrogenase (NAD)